MYDFDIAQSKVGENAQKILDRAVEEAIRCDHKSLTNAHIFLAFLRVEWDLFSQVMRDLNLNSVNVIKELEGNLKLLLTSKGGRLNIDRATKLTVKLAFQNASRDGRQVIEPSDLLLAVFEEEQGLSASIMRQNGVEPEDFIRQINIRVRDKELRDEIIKKRFELPPFLGHFATNLNLMARLDKIPPIYGRDKEIQKVLEVLCHRERSNSVMLIGEPGVGKTAIAEGLARRIEFNIETIPVRLRECQVVNLQMNNLVAGTMLRGMFEDRIQNVIREIKERPNLILFIDEAHTMVGAGSALGAPSDAANIFKSVLARGEVRIIAATTLSEYKQYIMEDEALARRFRCVYINEPTIEETRNILFKVRPRLEGNYCVRITDDAIETALEMSPRYQRHLRLPDKVIGWLDTASVRAEISRDLEVNAAGVIEVIADASEIPRDMVFREVGERFKNIENDLGRRVVGQKKAIKALSERLALSKGSLKDNFDSPDGVFLFLGPTGVGKTELAKALAEFLFGDDKKMIRIDMSEYQGEASADKLIGMPRGIVGSEHGGILTTKLYDKPCSVVLLDEIEKANHSVRNVFLQAFDEGWLTDGRGRRVYLSDAVVIMTSNLGSENFKRLTNPMGFRDGHADIREIQGEINKVLERAFPPEFRNRLDAVVIFSPLTKDEVRVIADRYLNKLREALTRKNKEFSISDDAMENLIINGHSLAYGARFLKRFIDDKIKIPVNQSFQCSKFNVVLRDGEITVEANGKDTLHGSYVVGV